jgi:hypothetical protein
MPYQASGNLPGESASKIGHLSVINDPLIQEMLQSFRKVTPEASIQEELSCCLHRIDLDNASGIDFVIAIDGSLSDVPNSLAQHKMLSYIKVASLCISMSQLKKAQRPIVDPEYVREILSKHADTFSTALPLTNVQIPGKSQFETIRSVIQLTFEKVVDGALLDTLNFLVSQSWSDKPTYTPSFSCPYCISQVDVPRGELKFTCTSCAKPLTVVDYLGLLMGVQEDSNDNAVAVDLLVVMEHLWLVSYLRTLIAKGPKYHGRVLLLKDGPLMLRGQYSRLIQPIRAYLQHLRDKGLTFYIAGVEKTGAFVTHIEEIKAWFTGPGAVFVPSNDYILRRIKHVGGEGTQYGERVLYGAKVYLRLDERNVVVLNIPTGTYKLEPVFDDLIGFESIALLLGRLNSRQFQNALLPIVAVNKIASMAFYPSNNILERFTDAILASNKESELGG